MKETSIEQRLAALERKTSLFRALVCVQLLLLAGLTVPRLTSIGVHAQESARALRVRTLIVEDDRGRARIIMGSPFPSVPERTRKDAPTEAIIFLDENGHDRLTLGRAPDPQVGGKVFHRIAPSFGMLIHDEKGDERGSYGWLANGRALVTLDRPGAEAWAAVVNDRTGETDMSSSFPPQIATDVSALDLGTNGSETFLRFKNRNGKDRAVFTTRNGNGASFLLFDDADRPSRDLIGSER